MINGIKMKTTQRELVNETWRRGTLSWKLYKHQLPIYSAVWNAISNKSTLKYVINCSRRFGKTTILCLIAIEYGIRNPNTQIRFAAPTAKSLRKSIHPIMKMLLADCPDHLKPIYKGSEDMFDLPNGSQIHFSGTDNGHEENLRGTVSHLNIVDEAGSMGNLNYLIKSILVPQTLTVRGTTIIASTPSVTSDHDYFYIYRECLEENCVSEFTIHDNKSLDADTLKTYMKEAGGEESTTFKREYLVQFVTDSEQSILPEWQDQYSEDTVRDEYFPYYHKYVSLDTGVVDYTAGLFAYYDYRNACIVVEDEYTINGPEMTTDILARDIRNKEKTLWGEMHVNRRIADNNNLILIADLTRLHNLPFVPTNKTSLEAMVNQVRVMINEGRLKINPRCTQTLGCVKYGIWKKSNGKKEFGRSKKYGHYDHLAALVYLVRNVDQNTNPVPATYKMSNDTHWINKDLLNNRTANATAVGKLFGR